MKWFLSSFLLLAPVFSAPSKDKFHICFFELDNTVDSKNFKREIVPSNKTSVDICKKKQEFSSANTVVHCYQPQIGQDETGAQAFKRMIDEITQAGDKCDGLVMSGHHTGDWYGGTGRIKLKDMEDLSCDPKYRDWFSNIKALWLDGCNTVTDNILKSSSSSKIPTPDSETARVVGKEYSEDKMNQSAITSTSQAYTASLDKNTPLSSRYLRMFPRTQIYGFNGAAPEGKKKTGSFIAEHLSILGSALQAEENQIKQTAQMDHIKRALSAISSFDPCDDEKMETWEQVKWGKKEAIENQDYKREYKLGCNLMLAKQILDDPDSLSAHKALIQHIKSLGEKDINNKQELLNLANELLNNPSSAKAEELAQQVLLNTLDEITEQDKNVREEDKTYTHLLFNNIYDTWKTAKKYKTKDSSFYKGVKTKLQADNFKISLKERIESNQTASLRKGDYIKFYMEANDLTLNKAPSFIIQGINGLAQKASSVFKGLSSPRQPIKPLSMESQRALAVSVVDQLLQYDLLTEKQIHSFLGNSILFPADRKNPFVTEVQANLIISNETQEKRFIHGIKTGKIKGFRQPVLRALSRKYFQNPPADLTTLHDVADSINLEDPKGDVKTFFDVIHFQFSGQTQKQKEDFIVEYSQKSNKNLEYLLLWYAKTNFTKDRIRETCKRLQSDQVQADNLSFYCNS